MNTTKNGPEGMILGGRYRITHLIGSGGMANVYLAIDLSSGARVAIKILKQEFSADTEFIKRFDTEAKAAASLTHSNIVKVLGIGQEGNFRYMVQEYVEGITVKDLINQNGHLDWRVAVPIVIQIGLALDHAHQNGIVHRDIKPHNIMITKDRIAKVTDFGIARAATSNTITLTSGGALGSVHYFSPEQARGAIVGPASDIYSVGVMLFEMVTGRLPFDGDTPVAIAVKHLQEPVPLASSFVPGVPQGLDAIIQKCMQKGTEYRYSTIREMVAELDSLMIDPNGSYGLIANQEYIETTTNHMPSMRQEPNYGKLRDIERSIDKRRRSRLRDNLLVILLVVVIVGVLIGILSLIIKTVSNSTSIKTKDSFVVANYEGRSLQEVILEFEALNFKDYKVEYQIRSDYAPDIIIDQSIEPGVEIKSKNNKLYLTVSRAEDSIILDQYSEMSLESAKTVLTAKGFFVTTRPEINDQFEPGIVIRTEPVSGTAVKPGSVVILVYSEESETITVPKLVNLTVEAAEKVIDENGLVIGQIEISNPAAVGLNKKQQYVLMTDPVAGTPVSRKSSIKLYIGTAEDAQRGGTPTPTPTPAPYILSLNSTDGGTVTGAGTYFEGSVVSIQAIPDSDHTFKEWVDASNTFISDNINYSFTMPPNDFSLKAVFEEVVVTPTPTATPTPTPTPTPSPSPTPSPTPNP